MSEGTARAQPFFCPYCGEPDIRPAEQPRTYACATCDRTWTLGLVSSGASR